MLLFAFANISVHAGGPLWVESSTAFTYGNPVIIRFDNGSLGKLSNNESIQTFDEIFAEWENVSTTTIKFQKDTPELLNEDVNETNYLRYFLAAEPLGYTPTIFDTDGKIIEVIYGRNASQQYLGFGGPVFGSSDGKILESLLIVNGKFFNDIETDTDPERTLNEFKNTIAHELGHVIGLDHSQINVEALDNVASAIAVRHSERVISTQELIDSVPLMFPIGISALFNLRQDDKSAVSLLYPKESELKNFGEIKGKVFRENHITPVLGVNVIARNLDDPVFLATSCVSGYLDSTGSFSLTAIPPGRYTLEVEPISSSFSGNSTVGPYARTLCDESFLYPVKKGYYSGPNVPTVTDENSAFVLDVETGKTINAEIIANTNAAASRHVQCNAAPPNFSTSSSSGNTNNLCCQGFVERQQDQLCPDGYIVTFCESLNLHGCCPDNGSLSSSSSSSGSIVITSTNSAPDCTGSMCGINCCISGCCESNQLICSNSAECTKDQNTTSSINTVPPTNLLTEDKPEFSLPGIIEPPVFLSSPLDTNSSNNNSPTFSTPENTINNKPSISFVEISSVINFPKIIELPLVAEEFVGIPAFAYPGSNPSIEIKLPSDQVQSTILYVHLKDSKGNIFQNIPFKITKIPATPDKISLSLQLPDQISTGKLEFTLSLFSPTDKFKFLYSYLNIIDYLNILTLDEEDAILTIEKPIINTITELKTDQTVTLVVKGKNFVGNKVMFTTKLDDTISLKSLGGPQTTATIFPSNLNIKTTKINVKSSEEIEVKFTRPKEIAGKTNATLVITTPRGIVSRSFVIKL